VRSRCGGFSYVALLILIAVLAVVATTTLQAGASVQRRHAEEDLLRVGAEFERALASYKAATPAGASPWPQQLDDLLADPRYAGARRHLRNVRADPLSGTQDWGIVRGPDGGIVALHSLAKGRPIKVSGFAPGQQRFENAENYAQWRFGEELALRAGTR
jgi:type II secretory pathway pseudopilin PulG